MATLLDLSEIYQDAHADPEGADADVLAAIAFRSRIEAALWRRARTILDGSDLPADPNERNELIGWAQVVSRDSRSTASIALRLALGGAPGGATRAQIVGASDEAIETGLEMIVPLLAKGRHPGR